MSVPVPERYLNSSVLRWTALALFLLGAAFLTFGYPSEFPTPYRIDIDVYRTGAQVFIDGGDLYGPLPELSQGAHLPFTYPPIAAALFTIFAIVPLWMGSVGLTLVSIASVAVVLRIALGQIYDRPAAQLWWLVTGAMAIGLWFGPVRDTLAFGQVNAVLMALVIIDAILGRGRWWGGTLIGLAIAIKLTPAVFLLLLVLRKDWRGAVTTGFSFAIFTGIGHLLMPQDSLQYWTQTLSQTGRIGGLAYASNQSLNAVLYRLGLEGSARSVTWFVVAMGVGLFIAWVTGRLLAFGHHIAATLAVGFAALFCSPVSWTHHWVWSLPLVVVMLVWGERPGSHTRWWVWLAASGMVVFLANPQWWFPHENDAELQWGPLQQLVGSSYLVWGLIALISMGLLAHRLGHADRSVAGTPTVLWPGLFRRPARQPTPDDTRAPHP